MKKKGIMFILIIVVMTGGFYRAYLFGKESREPIIEQHTGLIPVEKTLSEKLPMKSLFEEQPDEPEKTSVNIATQQENMLHLFYGTAGPYAEANVQGEQGGRITALPYREGDFVKKGDILVRFDESDTKLELQKAIAAKNTAMQQVHQAQSNFETAQANVNRYQKLFQDGFISQQDVDDVNNRFQSARSVLNSSHEGVKQADAQIRLLKNTLKDFTIGAPINGVIDEKHYNLHEIYRGVEVIYHLVDIDQVYVDVNVPEAYISQVHEQMKVSVSFDALNEQEFTGIIEVIVPSGKAQSRNFVVKVLVQNPDHAIKPGMFSRVHIKLGESSTIFVAEKSAAINEDGEGR